MQQSKTSTKRPDTVPRIPRSEWKEHPHYPSQTLLLGSHRSFRETSEYLIDAAKQGISWTRIRYIFSYWHSAMGGHEHYEESKLYPYLAKRYGVSMESLEEGHDTLGHYKKKVYQALDEEKGQKLDELDKILTSEARKKTIQALEDYHKELLEHLEEEEDTVIPLLLSLKPEEFRTYYHNPIGVLMKKLQDEIHS